MTTFILVVTFIISIIALAISGILAAYYRQLYTDIDILRESRRKNESEIQYLKKAVHELRTAIASDTTKKSKFNLKTAASVVTETLSKPDFNDTSMDVSIASPCVDENAATGVSKKMMETDHALPSVTAANSLPDIPQLKPLEDFLDDEDEESQKTASIPQPSFLSDFPRLPGLPVSSDATLTSEEESTHTNQVAIDIDSLPDDKNETIQTKMPGFDLGQYFLQNHAYEAIKYLLMDNKIAEMQSVLSTHIDVNQYPKTEKTLLAIAIHAKNIKAVQALIKAGARVNEVSDAINPLRLAIAEGSLEIVEFLIQSGADVNGNKKIGSSLISFAVNQNNPEIVQALIKAGAKVTAFDEGYALLKSAIQHHNLTIVKALVQAGANINASHAQSGPLLKQAILANDLEITKTFIASGANVNAISNGDPLIKTAVLTKNLKLVEAMIAAGAKVDIKDSYGQLPSHYPSTDEIQNLLTLTAENDKTQDLPPKKS